LGAELRDVFISELRDHTYYAKLRMRMNGELVEVDSRPSDAIALAVTASVPIYVAEDVLEEVCGNEGERIGNSVYPASDSGTVFLPSRLTPDRCLFLLPFPLGSFVERHRRNGLSANPL